MRKNILIIVLCILIYSCNSNDENSTIDQNCDSISEIVSEDDFNSISTLNYDIIGVELISDCLEITFRSNGCGTELWEENLFSVDAFYTVFPLQRSVKMQLINEELCEALFQKSISFDLTPLQLKTQSEIPLNIYGWNKQIIYRY